MTLSECLGAPWRVFSQGAPSPSKGQLQLPMLLQYLCPGVKNRNPGNPTDAAIKRVI